MIVYYADVRQQDGSLQTVEIMALSLADAFEKATADYGPEAVLAMSDSKDFGWKGKPPL